MISVKCWKPVWICAWEFYAGLKKTCHEFQHVLWTSSSPIFLALGNYLRVLINDFVGERLAWTVVHWRYLRSENISTCPGSFFKTCYVFWLKINALNFRSWIINRYVLSHDAILQLWHSPHLWSWTQGMAERNIDVCLEGDISPFVLNLTLSLLCRPVSESSCLKQLK